MNDDYGLLFAQPSFLEGLSRSIDIGDTLTEYNRSESGQAADRSALRSDWEAVGRDMRTAIEEFRHTHAVAPNNS